MNHGHGGHGSGGYPVVFGELRGMGVIPKAEIERFKKNRPVWPKRVKLKGSDGIKKNRTQRNRREDLLWKLHQMCILHATEPHPLHAGKLGHNQLLQQRPTAVNFQLVPLTRRQTIRHVVLESVTGKFACLVRQHGAVELMFSRQCVELRAERKTAVFS